MNRSKLLARAVAALIALALASPLFGEIGVSNPTGVAGVFNGNVTTGGSYDPFTGNATRTIDDIVVPGAAGTYPLVWARHMNSRNVSLSLGEGGGWTHSYDWHLSLVNSEYTVAFPDGRFMHFGLSCPTACGGPGGTSERLRTNADGTVDLLLGDGGVVHFETNRLLDKIIDPLGNVTQISYYDSTSAFAGNLFAIIEPGGRNLQISYINSQNGRETLISKVSAWDGRGTQTQSVSYTYTYAAYGNAGNWSVLATATYSDGTQANYAYQPDNKLVNDNLSPSGNPLIKTCDDVRFAGPMRKIQYLFARSILGHGVIEEEQHPIAGLNPETVSKLIYPFSVEGDNGARTETRGDGAQRNFSDDTGSGHLQSYTDFQGHTTYVDYSSGFPWHVDDARGHRTTYVRGTIGVITSVTYADGLPAQATESFTYTDAANPYYLKTKTDGCGNTTTFRHADPAHPGWITEIDYPDGGFETFPAHDQFGQVTTHIRTNSKYEFFNYDGRGLLTKQWNPTPSTTAGAALPGTTYTYYPAGLWTDRIKTKTLPLANGSTVPASETYEYDVNASGAPVAGRGLVTKITHADGTYQSFGYDIYGNKLWEENEMRQRTSYVYDEYKRVTKVTDPVGHATTFSYENTVGTSTSQTIHTTSAVRFATDPAGVVTANTYDANRRKITTVAGYNDSANAGTTSFVYDEVGNLTQTTDPLGHVTATTYDARDRKATVTAGSGTAIAQTTTFSYNDCSELTNVLRPDGNNEKKTYDPMHRLWNTLVVEDTKQRITKRLYNKSGTLQSLNVTTTVTGAASQITSFLYDEADRKIQMNYPAPSTDTEKWDYDDAGNLQTHTTPAAEVQSFTYDNRNRNLHMGWSNNADYANFGYNAASRLTDANNANSSVSRVYDAAGRLTHDKQTITGSGVTFDLLYTYDLNGDIGLLSSMTVGGGATYDAKYLYDTRGRLQYIGDTARGNTVQYSYDKASNVVQRKTIVPNGQLNFGARDALNRLPSRTIMAGTTTVSTETYGYDNMNRLSTVDRSEDGKRDAFDYNVLSEMNSAKYGLVNNANPNRTVSYDLDKSGNRNSVTDTGVVTNYTQSTTADALNQYSTVGGQTVGNGTDHQISSYQGVTYTYINGGRMTHAQNTGNTYDIKYDALGRAVSRTLNGAKTYYYYDGEKPINEMGATSASNVYGLGIDEIVIRYEPADAFYFYQDHEGSVTHVRDNAGAVEKYRYDAFGTPTIRAPAGALRAHSQVGSNGNRFLFTGREWNDTFDIYEYRARAYHPGLGRFMSEDPKGFDAGDFNLYRYCGNDPEDRVDPKGLLAAGITDQNTPVSHDGAAGAYGQGADWWHDDETGRNYRAATPHIHDESQPVARSDRTMVSGAGKHYDNPGQRTVTSIDISRNHFANYWIDAGRLARAGRTLDGRSMRQFANAADRVIGTYAVAGVGGVALGEAVAGTAAAGITFGDVSAAASSAVNAVQAAGPAALANARYVTAAAYVGVVIPTSSLLVTNPEARELLEEVIEHSERWP